MRIILAISITFAAFSIGCQSKRGQDAARPAATDVKTETKTAAKTEAKTEIHEQLQRMNNQWHDELVNLTRLVQGEVPALTLEQCYRDGYMHVIDDSGGSIVWKSASELGPKYIDKCARIETETKRLGDEINQEHKKETSQ